MDIFSIQSLVLIGIGIFAAILGVMFGAAGFVMLPAMLVLGIPIHASVAVNKFATGISSLTTMIALIINKKVRLRGLYLFMLLSAMGGVFGAWLATRLSDSLMNMVGCVALMVAFLSVMKPRRIADKAPKTWVSGVIGVYDGGLGPGSGSMYITYLLNNGDEYVTAAQKTRFLMFSSSMAAFIFYFFFGIVQWSLAIPLTIGSIIGSFIAVRLMPYLNPKWLRIILPVIFAVLIVQVVLKIF